MRKYDIIVCGTGGTGVVGLGMLLKNAGLPEGYKIVGSETRGSAQRGGVVTSSIRYAIGNNSDKSDQLTAYTPPSLSIGSADLMIATEASESLRQAIYLNDTSKIVLNTFTVVPKQLKKGKKESLYPSIEEIQRVLEEITPHVYVVNASGVSLKRYGTYRMTNPILLGVAMAQGNLPLKKDNVLVFLRTEKERDAFEVGYGLEVRKQKER